LFSALFSAIRSVCTVVIYPPEQDGKLTRANNDIRDAAVARVKLISNAVQASLTGLPESRDLAQLFWLRISVRGMKPPSFLKLNLAHNLGQLCAIFVFAARQGCGTGSTTGLRST
jgi:hypothetical protein